jgi:hypothetical protein
VLEVWFAGCHSDVGGGAVKDDSEEQELLSQISLNWMIDQVRQSKCGIILCDEKTTDGYHPKNESSECTETSFADRFQHKGGVKDQIHDKLRSWRSAWWWILEFIPTVQDSQHNHHNGRWKHRWGYVFYSRLLVFHELKLLAWLRLKGLTEVMEEGSLIALTHTFTSASNSSVNHQVDISPELSTGAEVRWCMSITKLSLLCSFVTCSICGVPSEVFVNNTMRDIPS